MPNHDAQSAIEQRISGQDKDTRQSRKRSLADLSNQPPSVIINLKAGAAVCRGHVATILDLRAIIARSGNPPARRFADCWSLEPH